MSLFTNEFFRVYPGREQDYQLWSTIAGLVGAFVCTLGTAIISDSYDNINYMTKAYMCMVTTLISIPCCLMTYMVTDSFWLSLRQNDVFQFILRLNYDFLTFCFYYLFL